MVEQKMVKKIKDPKTNINYVIRKFNVFEYIVMIFFSCDESRFNT